MYTDDAYFPPGALDPRPDLHASLASWYSSFLRGMSEVPLHPPAPDSPTTYRFLHLPSFTHPSVVRVTEGGGVWQVSGKLTDGQGGFSVGNVVFDSRRALIG